MITLTIKSENEEAFLVRFQSKQNVNGELVWADSEVTKEIGQSQRYGVDGNFRLVVEVASEPDKADGRTSRVRL
ncbi:hypothetical protein IVB40_32525 [Bradyrhizobium sp. 40]|uniref:hypothetical protein n=1 Tax=Bradyrhizobium sp. 40 TaxID=2782674 RepID=UPI001FFFE79B|nr:hypothetical protein [Bradyrhizobium sp. 40]UPJ41951.1 hypothetical protein IVB40_32525 [Bradyrhizobium sp. 40]